MVAEKRFLSAFRREYNYDFLYINNVKFSLKVCKQKKISC